MFQLGKAQLITVSFYIVLPLLHPVKNVSPWPEVTKTVPCVFFIDLPLTFPAGIRLRSFYLLFLYLV